jgi:acetate kinase
VAGIGLPKSRLLLISDAGTTLREIPSLNHEQAFDLMLERLSDPRGGRLSDFSRLSAVGHRIVHGGGRFSRPALIDDAVEEEIARFSDLAPLHTPHNLMGVQKCRERMPDVPQVAVFDSGFHQKIPRHAAIYGLPYEYFEDKGVRRYGFHGISHQYAALQAAVHLKRDVQDLKIVTCHLGGGASVCAIDHGTSVDTSTGMTPLEGLIMGTRCGDLDPGIILHLLRSGDMEAQDLEQLLTRRSGLLGLSGVSGDMRMLEEAAGRGDERALLAIQVFGYRVRKYIGSYVAALSGIDALVFTGGIGENSAWLRGLACQGLSCMGIRMDSLRNKTVSFRGDEAVGISEEGSRAKILVIPSREGRMIARETLKTLARREATRIVENQPEKQIPIEVSAHHVHLCLAHFESLFGSGRDLTHRSDLSQPGQYACRETVNLIGPKGRVDRVRVLGPLRGDSQIEISMTEEYKLGIKAPIRPSGDLEGTPGITLEGPRGALRLDQGVICAVRHIHMSPEDALSYGLKDRDVISVKVEGHRTLIFGDVLVRIHPDFRLSMHIDTDEANAAGIVTGMQGALTGLQDRA